MKIKKNKKQQKQKNKNTTQKFLYNNKRHDFN